MSYTAARQQGAIVMLWLHIGEPSCRPSLFTIVVLPVSDQQLVISR